jgi:hypothetical protein
MQATEKTHLGFTASRLRSMNVNELLEDLICPAFKTIPQRAFLDWLIESGDYYADKLLSDDAKASAEGLRRFKFDYANADCDWRQWMRLFLLEQVPARLWWAYAISMAQALDQA